MARYHVLLVREKAGTPWRIEFGARRRDDVTFERDEHRDHGVCASNLKVITTSDDQASIDAAVVKLNAKLTAELGETAARERRRLSDLPHAMMKAGQNNFQSLTGPRLGEMGRE